MANTTPSVPSRGELSAAFRTPLNLIIRGNPLGEPSLPARAAPFSSFAASMVVCAIARVLRTRIKAQANRTARETKVQLFIRGSYLKFFDLLAAGRGGWLV